MLPREGAGNTVAVESCNIIYIKEQYFEDNSHFIEMLDPLDREKQARRNYLFLSITYENNTLLVPLRTEMEAEKPFGIIGYSVPSSAKPNAGLDFRKILIVNDSKYIEHSEHCKIPASQQRIISEKYSDIEKLVINYVKGYVKSAIKGRERREKKYCFSTLQNFNIELGVIEGRKKRNEDRSRKNSDKPTTSA